MHRVRKKEANSFLGITLTNVDAIETDRKLLIRFRPKTKTKTKLIGLCKM